MSWREHLWGDRLHGGLRNSALRTGLSAGLCLSLVLAVWLFVANRVPFLERFAWERNLAALAAFALLALIPAVRFFRSPGRLLVSGIAGWMILSLTYWGFTLFFSALADRMGAFHLFVMGSVLYTLAATLAWIGTTIWNVRHSHQISHPPRRLTDLR